MGHLETNKLVQLLGVNHGVWIVISSSSDRNSVYSVVFMKTYKIVSRIDICIYIFTYIDIIILCSLLYILIYSLFDSIYLFCRLPHKHTDSERCA